MNPIIIIPNATLFLLALAPYVLLAVRRLWRRAARTIPSRHGLN
jgi:hypothetical protein